jgi:hypothetical protein
MPANDGLDLAGGHKRFNLVSDPPGRLGGIHDMKSQWASEQTDASVNLLGGELRA